MKRSLHVPSCLLLVMAFSAWAQPPAASQEPLRFEGIAVGAYPQEMRTFYGVSQGLPDENVTGVVVLGNVVYAATETGLVELSDGRWRRIGDPGAPVSHLQRYGDGAIALRGRDLLRITGSEVTRIAAISNEVGSVASLCSCGEQVLIGTPRGLFTVNATGAMQTEEGANHLLGSESDIRDIACANDGRVAVGAKTGLYLREVQGEWSVIQPANEPRSWALQDVRGVVFDSRNRLWFASLQGVGCLDGTAWRLYDGTDGLPYNDFTTIASGEDGVVWFGTRMGAIRYDGTRWSYRQGLSWVPDDVIRDIAVDDKGNAWFATGRGVGVIERRAMTLAEKAAYFSEELDKYNRRTPYGYVLEARLAAPGDKTQWTNHDSDNDGLWTAMYGAAECFRYGATRAPAAKERATKAFEALRFLSEVTQGGAHPAPPGFPARSILPTDGRNPNDQDNAERDRRNQQRDPAWKILEPRWPVSADGKWYWKTDTSSDELDGHYFFYALYYDLVAEGDREKARVRETTLAITDHLLTHDYALVDHDGLPTRWAQFGPRVLNYDVTSGGRGLNSLSILTYLKIALHMSGEEKYQKAYRDLIDHHAYAMNTLIPKTAMGPGTGNQSDDEMAFMGYYHLLKYEKDPELLQFYNRSLFSYFQLEAPERCPLFNYIFAACLQGQSLPGYRRLVDGGILEEAIDSLQRYRMDRIEWTLKNSHRLDVRPLRDAFRRGTRGHMLDGKVLPIDERNVNHWNHDPWQLDYGGNGTDLTDGAAFLLPYYMGLYHGFIIEK